MPANIILRIKINKRYLKEEALKSFINAGKTDII